MTVARRLVPGQVHSTTRRTARRALYLTPTPAITQLTGYLLGLCLGRRPSLSLHAFFAHVDHHHGSYGDRGRLDGPTSPDQLEAPSELPGFMAHFNGLLARSVNTHFGRGENFWKTGSYDNVEVHGRETLEEQLLYIWTQAVRDGIVARPEDYPGLQFLPEDLGKTFVYRKPEGAFFGGLRPERVVPTDPDALARWQADLAREEREALDLARDRRREEARRRGRPAKRQRNLEGAHARRRARKKREEEEKPVRDRSSLPAQVTLTISVPPGYEGWPIEEVRAHFRRLLDADLAEIRAKRAAEGKGYMGVERLLAQDPGESAGETWPTFGLNPRVACKDKETRMNVLLALRAWRRVMAEKRRDWAKGKRDVVFPRGCYGLWKLHGALVEGGHVPASSSAGACPPGRDAPT